MPEEMNDRTQDNVHCFRAVADTAGGDRAECIRGALTGMAEVRAWDGRKSPGYHVAR